MASEPDLSLQHLQVELARVDVRIQREVRRWQLAGQDPSDNFRGLKITDAEAHALAARPFGVSWGQTVNLGKEARTYAQAEAEAARLADAIIKRARRQGERLRLQHLLETFGLDSFERDALLVCLAPHLDLRYERLFGYLQDDVTRRRPTVNLVLNLLCEPGPPRLLRLAQFAETAPLFRHLLLERVPESNGVTQPLLGQALAPDEAVVAWLLGDYHPNPELAGYVSLSSAEPQPADAILAGQAWTTIQTAAKQWREQPPVVVFYGPDQAGHEAAARLLAAELDRPLFVVALDRLMASDRPPLRGLRLALRDARLIEALPVITGWDACLAGEGRGILAQMLEEVTAFPDVAVIAGRLGWQPHGLERDRPMAWLHFPAPDFGQRQALWQHLLNGVTSHSLDVSDLAGQFVLTAAQIRDAVATARDRAAQAGREIELDDLFAAARTHSSPSLGNLARKIEARYNWDDIVLPADQLQMLREIISTVRGRPIVLEEWGVGQKLASSSGVTVLFAGPPGTGKTMAAEVIAGELGLDLYKIDLSTVVNKYIGETEKNLGRIFDEAAQSNAILFFDEADAIFGKRSEVKDAHDRYANIEVSYLLQRMESYDGVTILATNLRANLDEAFTRRLQFAIDFPFPDEDYRLRIWQALFPPTVPRAADIDLPLLAKRFKLAGGNIRNIIVSAAYLAAADGGQVTMPHLLHGARRELQKMGRLLREKELTYE